MSMMEMNKTSVFPEIQPSLMAPLAEIEKGLASQLALVERHRFDDDASSAKESLRLPHPLGTDHHRQFNVICHAASEARR